MKKTILIFLLILSATDFCLSQLTSSNLPIIVINTNGQNIPNEPKIMVDMGIIYNGPGIRNNVSDPFNHYNGKTGIELHGNSSQMFPMKSYGLELWDSTGASVDKSLFGMPKESDWILYAPYTDKTFLRNYLAYTMSLELGHWAAHCRYVEVIINGDYRGVYVFMERLKRNANRVNVTKIAATDISGDKLSGGYIVRIDKDAEGWFSKFPPDGSPFGRIQFDYYFPKTVDIVPAQKTYIQSYLDSFEAALAAYNFQDPENGVRRFADINSFIDYFIVNEVSRNVDAYRLSTYFYKDRQSKGGKLFAGPVWDYDLAFRNADYCNGSSISGWAYEFNNICRGDYWQVPFWWNRLMQDTAFKSALRCRWKAARQSSLNLDHINHMIDSITNLVDESKDRHFLRWPILGQYVWPNPDPIPTTYAGEIAALKDWIKSRLLWMDSNIPNNGACFDWPAAAAESMIVKTYPNPFTSDIKITLVSKNDQDIYLQVTDAVGRIMRIMKITVIPGQNSIDAGIKNWSKGAYFLRFANNSGEKVLTKVIKY